MPKTLFEKIWEAHEVRPPEREGGASLIYVDLHLVHEVTSAQAFESLRLAGRKVRRADRTLATADHNVPTDPRERTSLDAIADLLSREQVAALERNCAEFDIPLYGMRSARQGIVHVIGPELGLSQPGITIACGDSHTSTHGAFGAIALGIGTSQVRDVLATQTLALGKLKVRRINVEGRLGPGVYAKDVILHIIRTLGVNGGGGYAYWHGGIPPHRRSPRGRLARSPMGV